MGDTAAEVPQERVPVAADLCFGIGGEQKQEWLGRC